MDRRWGGCTFREEHLQRASWDVWSSWARYSLQSHPQGPFLREPYQPRCSQVAPLHPEAPVLRTH